MNFCKTAPTHVIDCPARNDILPIWPITLSYAKAY